MTEPNAALRVSGPMAVVALVLLVLLTVAALRLALFGLHTFAYVHSWRRFRGVARALAALASPLPLVGLWFSTTGVWDILVHTPRFGWRWLIEVPAFVVIAAGAEMAAGAVCIGLILLAHRLGARRAG
ncbi:MAG: hypothetical protein AB7S26_20900 [Sandaracinaceae bacterium]